MKAKESQQAKQLAQYKKQKEWISWAAAAIGILVLLLLATLGYASNWWVGNSRTASFTPTASTIPDTSGTASTQSTAGGSGGNGGGGSGGGSTSTTERSSTSTSTTTNNTTTNNNSGTNGGGTLADFLASIKVGDNVNSTLDRARALGLGVDCHNELVAVQVCTVSDGSGNVVTLKNLLGGDVLTGITDNL